MAKDRDAGEIFPPGYEEVAIQMTGIKADMQRREQILKEEVSRKNDLIVYLAHDLKTPLTSVIGYLSLLEEATDMPPAQKAKYVFLMIGDGMGVNQINLTERYRAAMDGSNGRVPLCMTSFPVTGLSYTYSKSHGTTDSAAGGT
ncbi:alkaline phosphatase, partial [Parabacteroides distasonis]